MKWPFDQPPNCATFVTRGLIEDGTPILFISHDEDDHGWQFHDTLNAQAEDARIVCLSHVLELDPTMYEFADLPPGWTAWRKDVDSSWIREPAPSEEDAYHTNEHRRLRHWLSNTLGTRNQRHANTTSTKL